MAGVARMDPMQVLVERVSMAVAPAAVFSQMLLLLVVVAGRLRVRQAVAQAEM